MIVGNINGYINGSISGNISGSFNGVINGTEYTQSTNIYYTDLQNININGNIQGICSLYKYIGNIQISITGSVYINDYTGTYTFISQSVSNIIQLVSDPSNAPYQIIPYNKINSPGKS